MKHLLKPSAIFFLGWCFFVACTDKTASTSTKDMMPAFDLAAARRTIDSTNSVFAGLVAKGDSVGIAAMYTADAKLMAANLPTASGRNAIQSTFNGLFTASGPIELKPTVVDLWGDQSMLIEEGTYAMSQNGKEIDHGKYIVLWKMEDGKWKLFRDCFNSDLPATAPPKQ